jgi:hypothetical protein
MWVKVTDFNLLGHLKLENARRANIMAVMKQSALPNVKILPLMYFWKNILILGELTK